jgi:secreted trypsin-like serine protease
MKRSVLLLAAVLAVLVCVSSGYPAARVIGGSATEIQNAPWAVSIRQQAGSNVILCTGAIVDASRILTAAHCTYTQNGAPAAAGSLSIRAGISNFTTPLATDVEQDRAVTLIRVHPGYLWSNGASPDDIAVLGLANPLDLSGPAVQATGLLASGEFPGGATATISAFGRQSAGTASDGSLNTLTTTVDAQEQCGDFSNNVVPDADAIALCARAATGAICSGDSGGALVKADTHAILAVASAAPPSCDLGTSGVFVYIGAPEILRFIQGDNQPPMAPRANQSTFVTLSGRTPVSVGSTLTCSSGNWTGQPTITYVFLNAVTGDVLQQRKSSLVITPQDAGITISCRAIAANSGGTALLTTGSSKTVAEAPKLKIAPVTPVSVARGRIAAVQVVLRTSQTVSGRFGVCATPPARVGARACASKRVSGGVGQVTFTLGLRIKSTAPLGAARFAIDATDPVARVQATGLLHILR